GRPRNHQTVRTRDARRAPDVTGLRIQVSLCLHSCSIAARAKLILCVRSCASRPAMMLCRCSSAFIAALLNAVGLGIFEMSWNVMCPSCAGVLSANKSLKTLDRAQYNCAFCAAGYETTLDNLVEVTFTVSPRVRKIAAHSPDELPAAEYYRQVFWSSAIDLPDDIDMEKLLDEVTLEIVDLPPGERAILSLQAP